MKLKYITFLSILFTISIIVFIYEKMNMTNSEKVQLIMQPGGDEKSESPGDKWKFEFDMLKDPKTGRIPPNIKSKELAQAKIIPRKEDFSNTDNLNTYTSLGPTNLGGRTRAIVYDKRNADIILAGGISSGIFRTNNGGGAWTNVTPDDEFHNVSTIVQHPVPDSGDIWYYGTGEYTGDFITNSAGEDGAIYYGNGIYKSIDNGLSWTKLNSTNTALQEFDSQFDVVNRISIAPNGRIYAACYRTIMRSVDGGSTWSLVLGDFIKNRKGNTDVIVSDAGFVYASFDGRAGANTGAGVPPNKKMDGVWTFDGLDWMKIAGDTDAVLQTVIPAGWKSPPNYGRIVLALAPSNQNFLYCLYDNLFENDCIAPKKPEADLFKFDAATILWENRTANLPQDAGCKKGNNPFAVQRGYNLSIAVNKDTSLIVIGGTNAYRSTDGFKTNTNTTHIGGYANHNSYDLYPEHHPDVHFFTFHPVNQNEMLCGSDGGVNKTLNVLQSPVVWANINNNYKTYQYYFVALDPTLNSSRSIGGLQDNSTSEHLDGIGTTHSHLLFGDGAAVGVSKTNGANKFYYVSSQYGNMFRLKANTPNADTPYVAPFPRAVDPDPGSIFVTYFLLDPDNTEYLYYASYNKIYRNINASTTNFQINNADINKWNFFVNTVTGNIRSFAVSRGDYDIDTANKKLYMGTDQGRIYRLNNPAKCGVGRVPVNITGNLPANNGTVIWLAVDPKDDRKVLSVYSNYGVKSIFYTSDATAGSVDWKDVEGNLSLPSIRSCVIVDRGPGKSEYYVGTSVGLYSTTILEGAATKWVRDGATSIKYAVASSMAFRASDNGLLIGSHGNGMYYTTIAKDSLCEDFTSVTFPPTGWSVDFAGTNYWSRRTQSGYGLGAGSARFRFFAAPAGTVQSLITRTCGPTVNGDYIQFDYAYAPYTTGEDSLIIEASKDNGATYPDTVIHLYGKNGGGTLNTAPVTTIEFAPTASQWSTKAYSLPAGTNKIRFRTKSGFGNNLFLDNICITNRPSSLPFSIKLIIQGFYNVGTKKLNKKDTVSLSIRKATSPYELVDSAKGLLNDSSFLVTGSFNNVPSGQYYLIVNHKNSIETWSLNGGESLERGVTFSFDFTNDSSKAYGNNLKLVDSLKYAIFNGDVNQDGFVDLSDLIIIYTDQVNFVTGNVVTDLTGDSFVNLSDLILAHNNAEEFASVQKPPGAIPKFLDIEAMISDKVNKTTKSVKIILDDN